MSARAPGQPMRVVVAGATGLVGRACVAELVAAGHHVVALVRRQPVELPAAATVRVVDWEHLDASMDALDATHVVCALGTTMKQAGTAQRFRRVDQEYPLMLARIMRRQGARHFLHVSALGADPTSRIFYNRVKGEVERELQAVGFPSLTIARPSLLLGPREEVRPRERLAQRLGWLMPAKLAPIEARDVARALVHLAAADEPGVRIVESRALRELANPAGAGG